MKRLKVRVAAGARRQADEIDAWWAANRPAAPGLFGDELEAALGRLMLHPGAGRPFTHPTVSGLRRTSLRKTRYYVYYLVDEAEGLVTVVAVWHASRGAGPDLA